MPSEKQNSDAEYLYYDYRNGWIAREKVGNHACAKNRFEFYMNGEWINDYDLSLHLCDATMDFGDYSIFDYEEITEEEAMRRIAKEEAEKKQ